MPKSPIKGKRKRVSLTRRRDSAAAAGINFFHASNSALTIKKNSNKSATSTGLALDVIVRSKTTTKVQ